MTIQKSQLNSVLPKMTSNHFPVILDTSKAKWDPSPFRFENAWLKHHRFKSVVSYLWNNPDVQGWEGYKFMRKLKDVKRELLIWNKQDFGNVIMRLTKLENKIRQLDD